MVAANQGGTLGAAIPWAAEAVLAALRGELPERIYNTEAVAKWQARFGGKSLLAPAAAHETAARSKQPIYCASLRRRRS